jgi:hypothetical protein
MPEEAQRPACRYVRVTGTLPALRQRQKALACYQKSIAVQIQQASLTRNSFRYERYEKAVRT